MPSRVCLPPPAVAAGRLPAAGGNKALFIYREWLSVCPACAVLAGMVWVAEEEVGGERDKDRLIHI